MFREFYLRYPIAKSLISQFGIVLPSPPNVPFTPLDWQDDAYFARLFRELPWTHFIELIRMDDPLKRAFYEVEDTQPLVRTGSANARSTACSMNASG